MMRFVALLVQCARSARNIVIDARYGGLLCVNIRTWCNSPSSDYGALARIFKNRIRTSDVLVDIGCGEGRVIMWWLSRGLQNRMIGIKLDEEIAKETRKRLRRYENVSIITGDASHNIPADGTLFYLYNPFPAPAVEAFKNCLVSHCRKRGNVTVPYNNCLHIDVFQRDPAWTIEVIDFSSPSSPLASAQLAVIKLKYQALC